MGKRNRAAVVVLGDIGRSPRMQYHALSLVRQAFLDVDIVAYGGSEPHISLLQNQSIHIHEMPQWPAFPRRLSKLLQPLFLILKPIFQLLVLLWYLCVKIPAPDVFIVQNPPSVPTLVVVKFSSWFRHSAIIVDWHNFGYTLIALSLGRNSIFVAMYRWIEKRFGKMAHGSLCVTRAMQHELSQNWGIKATVLYDQPPEFFQPASVGEMHNLFCRISNSINKPDGLRDCVGNGLTTAPNNDPNTTPFTTQVGSDILLKQNRPVLLVSSTSWTPDEDFGILLGAALMYDRRVAALLGEDDSIGDEVVWDEYHNGKQFQYPRLLFIITGKGPEKEKYEEKIRKLKLKRVAFRTMWLSAEDYPLLLGSADLGVCLHTSSSGLDLPMKVVDMFGCGLPVCAVSYSCIKELVDVEKNGLLFSSSTELADELMMLFEGFPEKCDALKSMRSNLMGRVSSVRWSTAWEENAKPLIYEDTITELEDKLLEESFLSKDDHPQCKLADIIVEKLKQKDAQVSSGVQPTQKLDDSIIELYKGVGKLLNKYTSGKIPKAFKHVPSLQFWEEVLHLTEPEKWSPNAMYQATKIFASNMGVKKVERFYKFVLLPRVREDIRKNKRLHFALYQSLKKALYKPAAFNKGILFQLCESRTCTLREAVIIGSIIEKISIPPLHSSYFIKLLIEKKYALPYRVLDALVAHFMKFYDDSREMPVIWHQSLLAFAQRYKNELTKEDKANLNTLVGRQRHKLVSPEILRELNNSRNRGEKADDPMSITTPLSIVNKTIQEDRFDIPEVPMEED